MPLHAYIALLRFWLFQFPDYRGREHMEEGAVGGVNQSNVAHVVDSACLVYMSKDV